VVALRRIAFSALWQPLIPFDLLESLNPQKVGVLLNANDPFSLLCGFEICASLLAKNAKFEELGQEFLKRLFLEKKESIDRCNLFSACAIIAVFRIRTSTMNEAAPLYWTRLAALSHAGVLVDALGWVKDTGDFVKWAFREFFAHYLWTVNVDLRDAPRWSPEWIEPEHVYAELVGRVQVVMQVLPANKRPKAWGKAVKHAQRRLVKTKKILAAHFAGPFDDFRPSSSIASSSVAAFQQVEKKLAKASSLEEVPELFALANASIPSGQVVADVKRLLSGPLDVPVAKKGELAFLKLCARIARCTRDEGVANYVINRCIVMVRRPQVAEATTDIFEVVVGACAAKASPVEYYSLISDAAARFCLAIDSKASLENLQLVFDVLGLRDGKLRAALAKARMIAAVRSARV
jgi:hypothetical protein